MYLTPYQKKQIKFVFVLLFGIPATTFLAYKGAQYLSMADADPTPKEVVISNVTTNSLTVSWVTEKAVEAFVIPVLSGTEQSPVPDKRGSGKREAHYVELKSLEPSTEYSFILLSDGERYTSGSNGEYKFGTAPIGTDTPVPNPIHGSVTGSSVESVIVYAMFGNRSAYPVSAIVPSSGNWLIDLSALRKISDKSLARTTDDTDMILMGRSGLGKGVVLEGAYSSIFDSNGRLNQTLTMEISDVENLVSYFPPESVLGAQSQPPPPPPVDQDDEEPVTPVDPIIRDPDPPQEDGYTGSYVVKHDISWIDMVSGDTAFNLESGESTVEITNLTDVGFTVVWRSSSKEEGYIKYGTSSNNLDKEIRDIRDSLVSMGKYNSHLIESGRLEPETAYYFEIHSGTSIYNNGGQKYSVTTLSTLPTPPPFETRSGKILNASDHSDWIIMFKIIDNDELGSSGSSKYLSTLPDGNGNWILTIGDARVEDGSTYFSFAEGDILQSFFLGAESKKFDTSLSLNDIQLNVLDLGSTLNMNSVKLLSDYGIINLK